APPRRGMCLGRGLRVHSPATGPSQFVREEAPQRLACPVEPRLHRVRRDPENGRRLVRVELLDVAKHDDLPVWCGETLDGGPDELARVVALDEGIAGRVPGGRRYDPVPVVVEAREMVLDRLLAAPAPAPEPHERRVDDDAMEPGGEPCLAVEPIDGAEGG